MTAYKKAHLDELASKQYPHWIPIRHGLGIETFGLNAYRRNTGEAVVPEHDESQGGAPELFYVASGSATFSVGGEEVDAPTGTFVRLFARRGSRRHGLWLPPLLPQAIRDDSRHRTADPVCEALHRPDATLAALPAPSTCRSVPSGTGSRGRHRDRGKKGDRDP